jgi:hypothetical protein
VHAVEPEGNRLSALARVWRVFPWALAVMVGVLAAIIWLRPGWFGLARPETTASLPEAPTSLVPRGELPPAVPATPPPAALSPDLEARLDRLESALSAPGAGSASALAVIPGDVSARLATLEAEFRRLLDAQAASDSRLAALVQELETAGLRSGGMAGAAAHARDLFLLSAARRHLERGRPLGSFEPALRQSFGQREPSAVEALATWSRAPVSRRLLLDRLRGSEASPRTALPADAGFWSRLSSWLSGLVTVRRADGQDPAVVGRAVARLASDDLDGAVALLSAAPATPALSVWLEDARRLSQAEAGLERLELLALQPPPMAIAWPSDPAVIPSP